MVKWFSPTPSIDQLRYHPSIVYLDDMVSENIKRPVLTSPLRIRTTLKEHNLIWSMCGITMFHAHYTAIGSSPVASYGLQPDPRFAGER